MILNLFRNYEYLNQYQKLLKSLFNKKIKEKISSYVFF